MPDKTIVCLCHDVTLEDVRRAVAEGFDDLETLKRYTGAMMGPCQGKMCAAALRELLAQLTGRSADEVVPTTARPPALPVRLGALSGQDLVVGENGEGAPVSGIEEAGTAEIGLADGSEQ